MANSRSKNVFNNAIVGLICQILNLFLAFLSRTIFINTLGIEYLGLNGLFSNVLTVLSFTELGIGNAIIFSLYKPLASSDKDKISSLMLLYKKAYTILGVIIISVGMLITPFIEYIIKETPDIPENIHYLYILFLLNTGISYFFVYKKSIFIADQKSYVILALSQVFNILHFVINLIILYTTKNFILYLIVNILFTVAENVTASYIVNKKYEYLNNKAQKLDKQEIKSIFSNVKALAVYKFGSVIVNGTDNILVSALAGVTEVGIVSNYTLITTSANSILAKVEEAFISSVGNLNVDSDSEKKYNVFRKVFLISFWMYGLAACGLALLLNEFILIWIGPKYILDNFTIIAICLELYISGMQNPAYIYRTTLGLFRQGQISAVMASVMNIILSIVLYKTVGLCGIFFATSISKFFSYGIIDPMLIYREAFKKKVASYYVMYGLYFCIIVGIYMGLNQFLTLFVINGIQGFIIKVLVISVVFFIVQILLFFRSNIFQELLAQVKHIFKQKS